MADGDETAATDLNAMVRDMLGQSRYVVLGTIDDDGRPRVSPVYFTAHRYADLYWVSHPRTHHSIKLARDIHATDVV
jgi:predicted pyridoxine 5'-phosphate oxidase superfamily flavin-nucleotide-binding protein